MKPVVFRESSFPLRPNSYHQPRVKVVYYSILSIVMYLVPVVIMVAVYSVVTFTLVTRKLPGVVISSTRSAQERGKRKVIKMLIAVLVCFILCWTPQQCLLLYDVFRATDQVPGSLKGVKYAAIYLAYLNSALNPLLYGGFNDNFRRGFLELFRCLGRSRGKVHPEARGGNAALKGGRGGEGDASPEGGDGAGDATSHTLPLHTLPTVSSHLTSHRPLATEAQTVALCVAPCPSLPLTSLPCPSLPLTSTPQDPRPRRLSRPLHSVNSDDTTDISWQALHL